MGLLPRTVSWKDLRSKLRVQVQIPQRHARGGLLQVITFGPVAGRLGVCQVRRIAPVSALVKSAFGRSLKSGSPFTM
jgi:hypothetical protein